MLHLVFRASLCFPKKICNWPLVNRQPLLRIFEPILKNASKELLHGSHTRSVSISTPSNSGIMKFAKKQLTCLGCKAVIRWHRHYTADAKTYATSVYKRLTVLPAFSTCSGASQTLCSHCKGREAELYCKTVANGTCCTLWNASTFGSTMPPSSPLTDQILTSFWPGDALWEAMDTMPGVPRISAPGRSLHKVCCFSLNSSHAHYFVPVTSLKLAVLSNHCSRDCPIFYRRRKAQKDMAEARLQLDRWDFWACKFSHWLPASAVDILLRRAGSYRRPHHDACQDEIGLLRASRHTWARVT
jgi:hypothetical protein